MKRPREPRTRPDIGRADRKYVAERQADPLYNGRYAALDDEHLDFYAAPGAPPLAHHNALAVLGEITRHRARRQGPLADLPEPPPEDPEQVRYRHLHEGRRKAFRAYQDARKALSARRKERALIAAQKHSFLNNPPPRDRMARKDFFHYWTKRPAVPVDRDTYIGYVSALNYRDAASEVFEMMLNAFEHEPDAPVKVWIQREVDIAGPFCWGATAWDTGDFSDIRPFPKEDL